MSAFYYQVSNRVGYKHDQFKASKEVLIFQSIYDIIIEHLSRKDVKLPAKILESRFKFERKRY